MHGYGSRGYDLGDWRAVEAIMLSKGEVGKVRIFGVVWLVALWVLCFWFYFHFARWLHLFCCASFIAWTARDLSSQYETPPRI
jgi:hypothetical protein